MEVVLLITLFATAYVTRLWYASRQQAAEYQREVDAAVKQFEATAKTARKLRRECHHNVGVCCRGKGGYRPETFVHASNPEAAIECAAIAAQIGMDEQDGWNIEPVVLLAGGLVRYQDWLKQ